MRDTAKAAEKTEDKGTPHSEQEHREPPIGTDEPTISASSKRSNQGLSDRIRSADTAFHRKHIESLAFSLGNLWFSFVTMTAAAMVLSVAMAKPIVGIVVGVVLALLLYAVVSYLLGLRIDLAHERKVLGIRRAANLGAERIKIDDPQLASDALREVLCEWMHGAILLRSLQETSFWYRGAAIAQGILSVAAIAVFAALSPFTADNTSVLVGAAILLTLVHGWREIRASRLRGHACMINDGLDPTEPLADRLESLLVEVHALRRQRRDP